MARAFRLGRRGRADGAPRRADRGARDGASRRARSPASSPGRDRHRQRPGAGASRRRDGRDAARASSASTAQYALVERNGEPVERDALRRDRARGRRHARRRASRRRWIAALYLITAARPRPRRRSSRRRSAGGVDIVQIREKALPDGELLPVLQEAREVTRRLGVPLVVNDRPDLAVLVEADYVHVGQDDLPVDGGAAASASASGSVDARAGGARPRRGRLHRRRARLRDADEGGPARRSGSSSSATRPRTRGVPWFAIGGIDETNVAEVVAAGAERIAVVRAIGDAPTPSAPRPRSGRRCPTTATTGRPLGGRSPVAQLAEHPAVNRRVVGSSPTRGVSERPACRPFVVKASPCVGQP